MGFLDDWVVLHSGKDGAAVLEPSKSDTAISLAPRELAITVREIAESFAQTLVDRGGGPTSLTIANSTYKVEHVHLDRRIVYNRDPWNYLGQEQEYRVHIGDAVVEPSLQIYQNEDGAGRGGTERGDYRLYAFVKPRGLREGLLFSLNFNVGRMNGNDLRIKLAQDLRLKQHSVPKGVDPGQYKEYLRSRETEMADTLGELGLKIEAVVGKGGRGWNRVDLGEFEPRTRRFFDVGGATEIEANEFLRRFLTVSLVAGHFRENKGYQLADGLHPARSW